MTDLDTETVDALLDIGFSEEEIETLDDDLLANVVEKRRSPLGASVKTATADVEYSED